jgi:hypothetical protein
MALTEAVRDQLETTFTPMLRRAYEATPQALAFAFVDQEGECIDYVSGIDPFEAKVCAAHVFVLLDQLHGQQARLRLKNPFSLEIATDSRCLWARWICQDYVAVAVVTPDADRSKLEATLAELSREFRGDAGIETPSWDAMRGIEVMIRSSVGWAYAPAAFNEGGASVAVSDVLGRWTEPGGVSGDDVVCFRVRTHEGQELTLVHDPGVDGWQVRP